MTGGFCNNKNNNHYYLLTAYNKTKNVQGALHKWSPVLNTIAFVLQGNETTEGHKDIDKGGSHDSNSDLAYFGARALLSGFSKWRMEHREHGLSQPPLLIQACAYMVTYMYNAMGGVIYIGWIWRGGPGPQQCLRTVSSLSDQVIKRMSRCPWSPKMEPNLAGQQSLHGVQYNIPSLFTPHPLTNNHNLIYKR